MLEYKSNEIEEFRKNNLKKYKDLASYNIKHFKPLKREKCKVKLVWVVCGKNTKYKKHKKAIKTILPPLNLVEEMLQYGNMKICPGGYKYIEYKEYRAYIHRLICMKHYGILPKGITIHHKDFNKLNNNIDNLELLTWEEHIKRHH